MTIQTRRQFIQTGSTALAFATLSAHRLHALPLGLPLGLQLYSVREVLPKDFEGTLKKLGALGYREVEAAGFFGHSAVDVKQAMAAAGLSCVSAHYSWNDLNRDFSKIIDFHHQLGADYIICSYPGKDPSRLKDKSNAGQAQSFTMDDWRWNAEQFNRAGEKIKAAGLRFGYHNHTMEFARQGGLVPFEELLRLTDPALVTIEMDCGWVTVGGGDPVAYLKRYSDRISMLHVKDFKPSVKPGSTPPSAELGQGTTDYREIFRAASKGRIKHCFIEQEEYDMPPFEALKIDADYIRNLTL